MKALKISSEAASIDKEMMVMVKASDAQAPPLRHRSLALDVIAGLSSATTSGLHIRFWGFIAPTIPRSAC